jgi:NDP-sugar pyrophosphorylase family protein
LGTANALFCAKEFIKDDLFLVMMGDDITDYPVKALLDTDKPAVFGIEVADVTGYGVIATDEKGEVVDILEKQRSGAGLLNTGVYIMHRKFFDIYDEIPKDAKSGEYFLTHAPRILRSHGITFKAKKLDFWFGINTPDDLNRAKKHPAIL